MTPPDLRLSQIPTLWTVVLRAHGGPGDDAGAARQALLERYGGAVRRYLLGALRDLHAADDLFQEFALRLLQGDLRGADRSRGRFRDFVKGVLFHLIADYHRRRRGPQALVSDPPDPGQEAATLAEADRAFAEEWRAELLARAWAGLDALERASGSPWYSVLRLRAGHPTLRSPELAGRLASQLGRPVTAEGVRQLLHRARGKFRELLLYEVRQSLEDPPEERLEQELIDLGLQAYCQPAAARGRGGG
jgi:RNA polymerase sigma-70 factor (ECF subfamily)